MLRASDGRGHVVKNELRSAVGGTRAGPVGLLLPLALVPQGETGPTQRLGSALKQVGGGSDYKPKGGKW